MMPKIAIMTDSNSGITQSKAKELGIFVVPMPFTIHQKEYEEDINLSREQFFQMLEDGAEVSTSQPSLGKLSTLFEDILKEYDEIVYMPMSSGLSGSYQSAKMLAEDFNGRVQVVNDQRISATLEEDVLDALAYAKQGKTAAEIRQLLEDNRFNCCIYITVDSLTYLKRGGRITPTVAALGNLLKIKPIMNIDGGKLDLFAKARTLAKAEKIMIEATRHDIESRIDPEGHGKNVIVKIAHANCMDAAEKLKEKLQEEFPGHEIEIVPLALSIACHTGPSALGCGCVLKTVRKDA